MATSPRSDSYFGASPCCADSIRAASRRSWSSVRFTSPVNNSPEQGESYSVVGLTGAAAGLIALHTHCENGLAPHLLTFHLLPWLAVAGLAIWTRAQLPSRSFAP